MKRSDGTAANEINVEGELNPIHLQSNKENIPPSSQQNDDDVGISVFKRSQQLSVVSSLCNIKVPEKVVSVGRPKGKDKTAIGQRKDKPATGTKRKINRESLSVKKVNQDQCLKPFAEKTNNEQALTIVTWLTRKEFSGNKKVAVEEIVNDENIFQRLRNNELFLGLLRELLDSQAVVYVKGEVDKLLEKPWMCSKCKAVLEGNQVQCDMCLDWFHFKCVQDKTSKRHFICSSC